MDKKRRAFFELVDQHAPNARVEQTNAGHWRISHPNFRSPIFTGSTPSDHRAQKNLVSMLRREYRQGADHAGQPATDAKRSKKG